MRHILDRRANVFTLYRKHRTSLEPIASTTSMEAMAGAMKLLDIPMDKIEYYSDIQDKDLM